MRPDQLFQQSTCTFDYTTSNVFTAVVTLLAFFPQCLGKGYVIEAGGRKWVNVRDTRAIMSLFREPIMFHWKVKRQNTQGNLVTKSTFPSYGPTRLS